MNEKYRENKTGMLLLGVSLAVGLVISSLIVTKTFEKIKLANEKITVKGFSEKRITSDVAVWRSKIVARSNELKSAYEKLEEDVRKAIAFFEKKGIEKDQIDVSAISSHIQYKNTEKGYRTNEIEGYTLEQYIEISSDNVNMIDGLSKESMALIRESVELVSFSPEYYYSKFDETKINLIGEATKNAKLRADQFAQNSGIVVGNLKSASQGVFQVTPVNSTTVSGYGVYDTSTIEKSVKAVVTIQYSTQKNRM